MLVLRNRKNVLCLECSERGAKMRLHINKILYSAFFTHYYKVRMFLVVKNDL